MKVKERSKSKGNLKADIRKVLAANLERQASRSLEEKKSKRKPALKVVNRPWGAVYSGKPKAIIAAFNVKPENLPVAGKDGAPFLFQGRQVTIADADMGRFYEAFVHYSLEDLDRSKQVQEAEFAINRAVEMLGAIFYAVRRIHPEALSGKLGIEAESE